MRQIKVDEKCSGCGLCVVNSAYLQENDEGNAIAVPGMAIKDIDMEKMERVVAGCPEGALEIVDTGVYARSGKAGIEDIIADLKEKCNSISVKKVRESDIKLEADKYPLDKPYSSKEYDRDFSSENSARSAAKDEFYRLCYSESAYRPLLKRVFVEYKVNVLKPYYNCNNEPDSVYYQYNETVRRYLADAYAEISEIVGGSALSPKWKNFSIYLDENGIEVGGLKNFDVRSTSSGIITSLKDISNNSMDAYLSEIDFDYEEIYAGEGRFGKTKYKKKWYFSGFTNAVDSFMGDLRWAIGYMSSDIEEEAVRIINSALEIFEQKLKDEFLSKIKDLESLVQNK